MKNILLLLLSLFVVSCSTTSYVREYPETTYFSNLPVVSPTLTIVTYNSPYWTQNYWYSNNIYTNHWPYTNNIYSNDYFGYYGNYTHYYLPNYYPNYYTPYHLNWYNHCNNWNNWNYHYSNGHRNFTPRTNYNTPRPRQNNLSPRPVYYNTPRQNTNYNGGRTTSTPRPTSDVRPTPSRTTGGRR